MTELAMGFSDWGSPTRKLFVDHIDEFRLVIGQRMLNFEGCHHKWLEENEPDLHVQENGKLSIDCFWPKKTNPEENNGPARIQKANTNKDSKFSGCVNKKSKFLSRAAPLPTKKNKNKARKSSKLHTPAMAAAMQQKRTPKNDTTVSHQLTPLTKEARMPAKTSEDTSKDESLSQSTSVTEEAKMPAKNSQDTSEDDSVSPATRAGEEALKKLISQAEKKYAPEKKCPLLLT
mmetsp:Transcript_14177/g.19927  ORF Transcript_14177/g.19927 Transcript_14177/m.19927 type:complete len:232 (-) Transcript_14177:1546-2241(-)